MAQWLTNLTRNHELAIRAPIRPLAWEPPDAVGAALERQKEKKNERSSVTNLMVIHLRNDFKEFPLWLIELGPHTVSVRMQVPSLISLSGLRIQLL